jgi:hypothetical protein
MLPGLMRNRLVRGVLATLAASIAAFLAVLAQLLPHWLAPSSPPVRTWSLLSSFPLLFLLTSIALGIWLVPACLVLQWIMARRGHQGTRKSITIGLAASLFVWGALGFYWAWGRLAGVGAVSSIFLVVWLECFEILAKKSLAEATPITHPQPPARIQAVRALIEAPPLGASLLWVSIIGLVAGGFFGDGGDYRPAFTVDSPQRTTRAHVVEYLRPGGGCRSGVDQEIYLLPSSETWSPVHRGLLIWKGNNLWRGSNSHSLAVAWETERLLTVRAPYDTTGSGIDRREAFVRNGFTARTVTAPPLPQD